MSPKRAKDPFGRPLIAYDPTVLSTVIHPQTRRFFYAHECGHHALGHPLQGIVLGQEQQADCWGIVTLFKAHAISDDDVAVIQGDMATIGPGDWTHLPGPVRAINLVACLEAAGLKPHISPPHPDPPTPIPDKFKKAAGSRFHFISDDHDVSYLPGWVKAPKQITDGHLSRLARAHGAALAMLDENIPDSFLIPR